MNRRFLQGSAIVCSMCVMMSLATPLEARAAGTDLASNVLTSAGAGTLLESKYTQEEYIAIAREAEGALWGYTNLGIANVESGNLNIRSQASAESALAGKLPGNGACEVLEISGDWAHIRSGEVEGYVNTEFLLTGPAARLKAKELITKVVKVNTDSLKVRAEASTESEVITLVPRGEELEFVEELEGWVKVAVDDEEAYVSSDYVEISEELETAITLTELRYGQGVSDVRVDLVEYAKQFVGNPYVWGGTSLTKGADCSGFVLSVFKKYGISLSHSSRAQAGSGTTIGLSDLKPGDLVFYGNSRGSINHVAIYIGGSKVVHASSARTGIKISNYTYRSPVKAVRIIQD